MANSEETSARRGRQSMQEAVLQVDTAHSGARGGKAQELVHRSVLGGGIRENRV